MRCLISALLLLLLTPLHSWAQGAFTVTDTSGLAIYIVNDGRIVDAKTHGLLLMVRSNLVYSDTTDNRESIELLVKSEDIFAKNAGQALRNDMTTVLFTIARGSFYLGNTTYNNASIMASYKMDNKGNLGLFYGQGNIPLAWIQGNNMTTGELVSVFYLLMERLQLDKAALEAIKATNVPAATRSTDASSSRGIIRKVWNTGQDEFLWDGITIKRRFSSVEYDEWKFDGRSLKRAWYTGDDEFTWDGQTLKRKFNTNTDEFEWDGKILRRRWNTGQDEFSVSNGSVKRLWNAGTDDEWEIDGDIPIPVIAMVVFGLLKK